MRMPGMPLCFGRCQRCKFYISFAANIQQVTTKVDRIQNTVVLIESHLDDVARYIQERLPMKDPGDGPDWMIP